MPQYWFMFPVAICISALAIASGVAGATFFTPIFLLLLGLPLRIAIAASLITATFGFASGVAGYQRRSLVDYPLGRRLAVASVPMALAGVWLGSRIDTDVLRMVLGGGLLAIAAGFLRPASEAPAAKPRVSIWEGIAFAAAGGLSLGMISAGLGELNAYYLIRRRGLPGATAVATSVFVVAITVAVAAAGHLVGLLAMDAAALRLVGSLVLFTVPGVVIGAQIGCRFGARAPRRLLLRVLGVLFVLVAALVLYPVLWP